jgi:hypothetical protein
MSNEQLSFRTFTEDNPNFALIIDGEVAGNFSFPSIAPEDMPDVISELIAIFKSAPTIVKALDYIELGSTWDGLGFTPPT